MARNVNDMNETEANEREQQGGMPDRDEFLDVLGDVSKVKGKIAKMTGDVSARLTRAENDRNLDKKAFAVIHWATRQEPSRVGAFLRHFDAYRGYADLDNMAGSDLFEGATKAPEKTTGSVDFRKGQRKPKAAKPPKAAKKAKETPPSGKRRGRPPKAKGDPEPVSAAEAAAQAWGLEPGSETAGAA